MFGVVMGVLSARLSLPLGQSIEDIPTAVLVQFLMTFAVWVLADRLHLSAIVTLVAYAMTLARRTGTTGARRRIASYAVWDVSVFVLNVLAFILIGLQLRGVVPRLHRAESSSYLFAAAAVSTLVLQGLTLRSLLSRVLLHDEDEVERELRLARVETARAALSSLTERESEPAAQLLRREYAARVRAAAESQSELAELQRHAVMVQRERLVELRAQSLIGDDAFHAAEAEIDLLELSADGRVHPE